MDDMRCFDWLPVWHGDALHIGEFMKIYLAGPMRGLPGFNYHAFFTAAAALQDQGHVVYNPARQDIERDGIDWGDAIPSGDPVLAAAHGFNIRNALADDMEFICRHADAIALLPGWEQSKGAIAERATAIALGLEIIEL